MADIFLYIGFGIFLIGVAMMFLGIITFVKSKYPIKGRLAIAISYLLIGAICFKITVGWVAALWIGASVLTMIDLKIYETKQI